MNLNDRMKQLEDQVAALSSKLIDLSANTQDKFKTPLSISGGNRSRSILGAVDSRSGYGQIKGGAVIWNTSELDNPSVNREPPNPEDNKHAKGYNKHTHTRFSGGALLADALEIVQYDFNATPVTNKHSQAYWDSNLKIKKTKNSDNESVDMIGNLKLIFNPDTQSWGVAAYEIDVKKCWLVTRNKSGAIELDSNGNQMMSRLYNEDTTKTSIVWDKNGKCWRLYAAYASGTD